jgi:cytochrome c553
MTLRGRGKATSSSLASAAALCLLANAAGAGQTPPYWAFAIDPPAPATAAHAGTVSKALRHVPNSTVAFTVAQLSDLFDVPDWHPENHPAMPDIVMHGRRPAIFACGYCHLPNGEGRPENASLAGLPMDYIIQQLADFKSGQRKSSQPQHLPTALMIDAETKANESEIRDAARYFSSLRPKPWIRVVETNTVAGTHVAGWMLVESIPRSREPIGQRIIEMPENLERTELRDDTSGFVAYVPLGSLKQGEAKTAPCVTCHGPDLRGVGNIPSIAGRSPSYVVRQLYDIQHGARMGDAARPMRALVEKLTISDMVSIAAYAASLPP